MKCQPLNVRDVYPFGAAVISNLFPHLLDFQNSGGLGRNNSTIGKFYVERWAL